MHATASPVPPEDCAIRRSSGEGPDRDPNESPYGCIASRTVTAQFVPSD